jgi:hypothetical protein
MIDQGRRAAEAKIPEILQALERGVQQSTPVQAAVSEELEKARRVA